MNNAFALDSAWIQPEESRLFQGAEKPLLLSNQVAMAVARPAAASRPLPTLVLAPQLIPGQDISISIIKYLPVSWCFSLNASPREAKLLSKVKVCFHSAENLLLEQNLDGQVQFIL